VRWSGFARRALVLAGIALAAAVIVLAADAVRDSDGDDAAATTPEPTGEWYVALAAPYPARPSRERTSCGHRLNQRTLGVAHPVLPCGVKLFLEYNDTVVLTQVVDRGLGVPGREFDVTRPLARKMGLEGTQRIRWSYASE
jgi:rare lipoprotein A (peptidoglycan hydrolase)